MEGDNNSGNEGELEKYVKSASGVAARTRSACCHERGLAPGQETTNPPSPRPIHLESQITTSLCRSPGLCANLSGAPAAPRPVASARYN